MGGAAGITFLVGMIRTKFAAVLIGTTGVGLMAGFTAVQGFIGTLAGMGIQSSAVREIAIAVGQGDEQAIGRAVLTLRRVCWLTGLVGMVVMMAVSQQLSRLTFNSNAYTVDIAALGIVILLSNLAGGQLALLQGTRRISDMARANIGGAILGALSAISFYYWLGIRGIIPSLVSLAVIQLLIAWFFARRVPVPRVSLTWGQTLLEANGMVKLGLVLMWNGLMLSAVSYYTITLISREINLHAAGLYSAAFLLSGMSVNFVLGAMGADYYPRLTGVAHDKAAVNRLVNEQTEVGLILALPGLLATLVLSPWIVRIFYTREFLGAVELLQWFVMGCLWRVVSWPLGYVILALGKGRWYLLTETGANLIHVGLITIGLKWFGIEGVAIAFFGLNLSYIASVYLVCFYLTGFNWSSSCYKIFLYTLPVTILMFIAYRNLAILPATAIGVALTFVISVFCLRELVQRVGSAHRIVRLISALPGIKLILASIIEAKPK